VRSEVIRAKVERLAKRSDAGEREYIRGIYEELAGSLEANTPWGI